MKIALKVLALGAALAASTTLARASSITGVLNFASTPDGSVTYSDGGNPGLVFVNPGDTGLGSSGSLGVAAGNNVSFVNFTAGSLPATPLFTVSVDGITFTATSDSVAYSASDFLSLTLFGTISETGFTDTPGILLLSTQGLANSVTSYSGTLTASPEPSSLALLGTTLLGGAGLVRRRLFRK